MSGRQSKKSASAPAPVPVEAKRRRRRHPQFQGVLHWRLRKGGRNRDADLLSKAFAGKLFACALKSYGSGNFGIDDVSRKSGSTVKLIARATEAHLSRFLESAQVLRLINDSHSLSEAKLQTAFLIRKTLLEGGNLALTKRDLQANKARKAADGRARRKAKTITSADA